MAKILDSIKIDKSINKVVETNKGYIINSTYYSKDTMTPQSLACFPTYGGYDEMSLSKTQLLKRATSCRTVTNGSRIVVDSNDPTISYIFTCNQNNGYTCILKIREFNNKCELLQHYYASISYGDFYQYWGQDDEYLYICFNYYSSWNQIAYMINKNSLAFTSLSATSSYSTYTKLYEDDKYIYIAYIQCYNSGRQIMRYDKQTHATSLPTNDYCNFPITYSTDRYYSAIPSDIIWLDDDNFMFYQPIHEATTAKFHIMKVKINLANSTQVVNMVTMEEAAVTWSSTISGLPNCVSATNNYYKPVLLKAKNGKTYLSYMVYTIYSDPGSTSGDYSKYGIYTFLVDDTTKDLTLKSFTNFSGGNTWMNGGLDYDDGNCIIMSSESTVFFTKFSTVTEKYELVNAIDCTPWSYGVDSENNVWILNGGYEVEMVSPTTANSCEMEFEKGEYTYEDTDISTYIDICTKNVDGVMVTSKIKLTINGNATWNANGTKTLTVTTLETDKLRVPLTIKNKGSITIVPQLVI